MGMGKGKRKLPMELIKNKQSRMVSFSKRRKGLMKKAEEFNSITGCSIAVIVLSEAGRPFVYGAPSFDSVIHRFQQNNNDNNGILTHSHSHSGHTDPLPAAAAEATASSDHTFVFDDALSLPPEILLLMGGQISKEEDNATVYGTHADHPENVVVPDHSCFHAPPEILIGQYSTADSHQENVDFYLIDSAPWLAALPDLSFHALPPPDQVAPN